MLLNGSHKATCCKPHRGFHRLVHLLCCKASANTYCLMCCTLIEHAKELGNPVNDEEPMIFLKAGSTILQDGLPLPLPVWSQHVSESPSHRSLTYFVRFAVLC